MSSWSSNRRRYTREEKERITWEESFRPLLDGETPRPLLRICADYDVHPTTYRHWLQEFHAEHVRTFLRKRLWLEDQRAIRDNGNLTFSEAERIVAEGSAEFERRVREEIYEHVRESGWGSVPPASKGADDDG